MIRLLPVAAPALLAAALLSVAPAPASAQDADAADLVVRLDQLQNQMRQLTGAIEQLQYRNQQLEQQLRRMQEENDYRFQQLGARGGGQTGAQPAPAPQGGPSPVRTPVAPAAPGRRSDVFDPARDPSAPGVPRALGDGGVPVIAAQEPQESGPIGAPGGREAGAPLDLSTMSADPQRGAPPPPPGPVPFNTAPAPAAGAMASALPAPPSNTPKDEYDLAYGYVLRKDYALAEQTFRDFLKKYPNDAHAPEARYWLGESLYQRQRYQDAADSFLVVVRNHDKAAKAPDALLRLGQSLAAIGQKEMACASFGEVARKYPRASASVKRSVEQEQKRVKC